MGAEPTATGTTSGREHTARPELEQIQFLPGHVFVQTTEEYLGGKQRFRGAVSDKIGSEPWDEFSRR
jgi:hypothetical protein